MSAYFAAFNKYSEPTMGTSIAYPNFRSSFNFLVVGLNKSIKGILSTSDNIPSTYFWTLLTIPICNAADNPSTITHASFILLPSK